MNQPDIQQVLRSMLAIDDSKTYAYSTRDFEDENGRFGWITRDDGTDIVIAEKSDFELMQEPYNGLICAISLVNRTPLEPYGVLETIREVLKNNAVPFAAEDGGIGYGHNIVCVLYIPLELREKAHQLLKDLGVTFEKVKTLNPKNMDQNHIISRIDELLASGYAIDELVELLSPMLIIQNYKMLVHKGATIDFAKVLTQLNDDEALHNLPSHSAQLLASGVDPQLIVDRCMAAKGSFVGFVSEWLPGLLLAGAHVDSEKLVQKLLGDDSAYDLLAGDAQEPFLRKVRAAAAAKVKLQDYQAGLTAYGKLSGKQPTKIFFDPLVKVAYEDGTKNLPQNWAGRILPGQTVREGIAAELKEVYGYTGRFDYGDVYFRDYAKDRKGNNIERYAVTITLFPSHDDILQF